MRCYPYDSDTIKLAKPIILELLRDRPWNEVSRGSQASLKLLSDWLFADLAFEADLDGTKDVR